MQSYDPDSGLVFKETIIRAPRNKSGNQRPRVPYVSPKVGTQSLFEIAQRKLLCNLDALTPECLASLPPETLDDLWSVITRHRLSDCAVWRVFASSGSKDRSFRLEWHPRPHETPLPDIFSQATSLEFKWLTDLTISDTEVYSLHFANLSSMANLRTLCFSGNDGRMRGQLTDNVFRSWATQAREAGALSKLQMVFIVGQDYVTDWSLEHASSFPALDTFCLHDCGRMKATDGAGSLGWARRGEKTRFFRFANSRHVDGEVWTTLVHRYVTNRRKKSVDDIDRKPGLSLNLGLGWSRSGDSPRFQVSALNSTCCFERDMKADGVKQDSLDSMSAEVTVAQRPVNKKRKIRGEKSVVLGDMLALF